MADGSSGGSVNNTIVEGVEVIPRIRERRSKRRRIVASGDDRRVANSSSTTKYGTLSRSSKLLKSDDDLFCYFDDRLQGKDKEMVCPGKGCDCLTILENASVREAIARYLVWFERKTKYDQNLLLMEWYRYSSRSGWRYLVPFDGDSIEDNLVVHSVLEHRLCQ